MQLEEKQPSVARLGNAKQSPLFYSLKVDIGSGNCVIVN